MSEHCTGRVTFHEDGDANHWSMLTGDGRWWLSLLANGEQTSERQAANFRRMAACWNVFAIGGIPTDAIEAVDGSETVVFKYVQARRERDALLAALKGMMPSGICLTNKNVPDSEFIPVDVTLGELRAAAAAISNATESQRIAADLHRNAMKDSGELQRRETDRALVEQIKWETPT